MKKHALTLAITTCLTAAVAQADGGKATYNFDTGELYIPKLDIQLDANAQSLGLFNVTLQHVLGGDLPDFNVAGVAEVPVTNQILIGADNNNPANPLIQPTDDALAGGGRNQSLLNGDVLYGGDGHDILIGGLGIDVLMGGYGHDILIGGTEDFPADDNRDRAFGGYGYDVFLWNPGDGSDYFNGGPGAHDTIIFGLIGEPDPADSSSPTFGVQMDGTFDGIYIDPTTNLPIIDVSASPGFCSIIDKSTQENTDALNALNLDHLVRFSIRGIANSFAAGTQTDDNGLRVTLHLKDVEYLVCTARDGGAVEVWNLATTPASIASIEDLPARIQTMVR